jgi:hypothetical protein
MLRQVIYYSTASKYYKSEELYEIVETSSKNNKLSNITGMLLYYNETFLQVLEGECDDVYETFNKIKNDSRHYGIFQIVDEELGQRNFPEWFMGFRVLNSHEFPKHSSHVQLNINGFDFEMLGAKPSLAIDLLLSFSRR